ncbi:MAG: hypothetical protein SH850_23255 [Planctomycetaceae bacterium]|nr:hypothetical protein [Planctomycetaceae bacterium]
MIDPTRQQLIERLVELSELAPDYRFGQMICNLAHLGRGTEVSATWDIEDAELLAAAEEHLANWKQIHEAELAKTH